MFLFKQGARHVSDEEYPAGCAFVALQSPHNVLSLSRPVQSSPSGQCCVACEYSRFSLDSLLLAVKDVSKRPWRRGARRRRLYSQAMPVADLPLRASQNAPSRGLWKRGQPRPTAFP